MFLIAQGRQVMKTGPNDASGVVWAIGKFVFFFHVLLILIIIFRQEWGGLGKAVMTKMASKSGSEFWHVFCSFCTMFYVLLFPSIVDCQKLISNKLYFY